MPARPPAAPKNTLSRDLMEQLLFGAGRARRFTQDSPILPDVWLEYAKGAADATRLTSPPAKDDPFPAIKLLLTPYREVQAGTVRAAIRERIPIERPKKGWREFGHEPDRMPRVVYNQSTVGATLYFEDLVRVVLPMTDWWSRIERDWPVEDLRAPEAQKRVAAALKDPEHPPIGQHPRNREKKLRLPPDLLWLFRVVGAMAIVRRGRPLPPTFTDPRRGVSAATDADWLVLVRAVSELLDGVTRSKPPSIHSVSLNREATPTVSRSTLAVKADAARRLFEISCKDLTWAIIDSGIDARHPAFRRRAHRDGPMMSPDPFANAKGEPENCTRIVDTYDFTEIDLLLDPDTDEQPASVQARRTPEDTAKVEAELKELNAALNNGRSIDWGLLAPLLRVPPDKYKRPGNDHGTHVAGILAGDWRADESHGLLEDDLRGMCPDMKLYDLRVLNDAGRGDEFAVMAALQFIRFLNSTNEYVVVHGVNLSLSIPHDVSNYACGRTPVCDECERLTGSGVVVVAAAGNQGYRKYTSTEGVVTEAYSSISITDPGNAEQVITVGATHRYRPHMYGVSYFSSRGPTGDGRIKPDLVAPGEKITAPLPDETFGLKDGTSMAAPHVSGAAAMLMARHNELVGRPGRIKQILCSTATDLGRERYFQGAGMLDVLRALQSV
jgi:subtilisin family serine protease